MPPALVTTASSLPADVFAPAGRAKVPAALTDLVVYPSEIQLTTARDRQSIVVQATYADGITRDAFDEGRDLRDRRF